MWHETSTQCITWWRLSTAFNLMQHSSSHFSRALLPVVFNFQTPLRTPQQKPDNPSSWFLFRMQVVHPCNHTFIDSLCGTCSRTSAWLSHQWVYKGSYHILDIRQEFGHDWIQPVSLNSQHILRPWNRSSAMEPNASIYISFSPLLVKDGANHVPTKTSKKTVV